MLDVEEVISNIISTQILVESDIEINCVPKLTQKQLTQLAEIESKLQAITTPRLDHIIMKWLAAHEISQYSFNPDLSVNTAESIVLSGYDLTSLDVQFNRIGGVGNFIVSRNRLSSFKGFPSYLNGNLYVCDNAFTSLKDIHKTIKHVNISDDIAQGVFEGVIDFGGNPITSHVLGLCLIKGVKHVKLTDETITINFANSSSLHNPIQIEKTIVDSLSREIQQNIDKDVCDQLMSKSKQHNIFCSPPNVVIPSEIEIHIEQAKKKKQIWIEQNNLDLDDQHIAKQEALKKVKEAYKYRLPPVPGALVNKLKAVQDIINKHLDDVILCQNALIDAGFEEYARL